MADPITCAAGCKREVADMDSAIAASWDYLPITGRWRCPDCTGELVEVNERYAITQPDEDVTP